MNKLVLAKLLLGVFSFFVFSFADNKDLYFRGESPYDKYSHDKELHKERIFRPIDNKKYQVITLAGGCFWCVEADMEKLKGVRDAISGYSGGSRRNATYEKVSKGKTKHREVVQVWYDSSQITLKQIIQHFFKVIDPTDSRGQFADRGFHYSPAIFYQNETEKKVAETQKGSLDLLTKFSKPIVVPVIKFKRFYPAEIYHQDYYKKNKQRYQSYRYHSGRGPFIKKHWGNLYLKEY